MIFNNQSIGKEVTIDLDTFFFYFVRPADEVPDGEKQGMTLQTVRDRLKRLCSIIGHDPIVAQYRRSSNDHAHVRLQFVPDLSVLDGFMIRAFMLDDQTRLELDLARYLLTGSLHEMNRCFDEKATVDGTKHSGPWISLQVDRDQYARDALKDWSLYLPRWEIYKKNHPELFGKTATGQKELI
jgi:hypothetical protein